MAIKTSLRHPMRYKNQPCSYRMHLDPWRFVIGQPRMQYNSRSQPLGHISRHRKLSSKHIYNSFNEFERLVDLFVPVHMSKPTEGAKSPFEQLLHADALSELMEPKEIRIKLVNY